MSKPNADDELAFLGQMFGGIGNVGASLIRQTLSKIRLGDPTDYVLMLVASAVSGGASFINVYHDTQDFVLEYDGRAFTSRQLQDLYSNLKESMEDQQLRKLALGLNAAFTTEVEQVVVESWDGTGGARLVLSSGDQQVTALKANPSSNPRVVNRVRLKERGKIKRMTKFVTRFSGVGLLPEAEAIKSRCLHAGPAITVNGTRVNQSLDLGAVFMWRHLRPSPPLPHLDLRPQKPRGARVSERNSPGPFSAVLALGGRPREFKGINLIVGGTVLAALDSPGFSTAVVVASAAGLESDLKHTQIVPNPTYTNLLELIRQELLMMALEVLDLREQLNPSEELDAAVVLEDLASIMQHRNQTGRLEEVLRAVVELRERSQGSGTQELMDSRFRLLQHLESQGKGEEAKQLYERLIPALQSQGHNHLAKHRVEEAVAHFSQALELQQQVSAPDDLVLAKQYHELGQICKEHRHPAAEDLFRRALAIRERRAEEDPQALGETLHALADTYRSRKCYAEAEQLAQRALDLTEARVGPEHPHLVPHLKLLAEVYKATGRYGECTELESRAMLLKYRRA